MWEGSEGQSVVGIPVHERECFFLQNYLQLWDGEET